MEKLYVIFFIYLALINMISFASFGSDKYRSKHDMWRISEKTLLLLATAGGAFGAFSGMYVFRHKTNHTKFKVLIPVILLIWTFITLFIVYFFLKNTLKI